MTTENILQTGTCAKCGKQAEGKIYKFFYGTKGGKVLGNSEALICSDCEARQAEKDRTTAIGLLVGAAMLILVGILVLKSWLAWILCYTPGLLLIFGGLGYFTSIGTAESGEKLAIELKKTEITQRNNEVNQFWDSKEGEAALMHMKEATIETCAKCGKEAVGKRYQFHYGWVTDQKTQSSAPIGFVRVRTTTTSYRHGGTGNAFICDECAGYKPNGSPTRGEKEAINVLREQYLREQGSTTVFWTSEEFARLK